MARYWIDPHGRKIKCDSHKNGAKRIILQKYLPEYLETLKEEETLPREARRAETPEDYLFFYKNYAKCDDDDRDILYHNLTKRQRDTIYDLTLKWIRLDNE